MFDRAGKDASNRSRGARKPSKGKRRPTLEMLEGRALMTAGIEPIAGVTVPQYLGYQVPVQGTTSHQQTYTVTSDNPGIKASIAQGQFLTIHVQHTSSGAGDVNVDGDLTFQLFNDFSPIATNMISSLVNGTATNTTLTTNNAPLGQDFYTNNGKNITRIQQFPNNQGYVIQGGANTVTSASGTTSVTSTFKNPFPNENTQSLAFTNSGQLALANAGPDTNDSSFFITSGAPATLNFGYTIFGQLVEGQDVLTQLTQVKTTSSTTDPNAAPPVSPVTITAANLSSVSSDAVIHLDSTVANEGATANITVTATDVTDGTTASQTFQANVVADPNAPERPYISQYDPNLSVASGQTLQFQIYGNSATPGDPLTYTVQGGVSSSTGTSTFTAVDSTKIKSASVDANGLVTIVPQPGASGTTPILIGVRDSTDRTTANSTAATLNSPGNYQYHTINLTFTGTATPVSQRPISQSSLVTATAASASTIQLVGTNPNTTNNTQPVTFTLDTQPTHGTISNFNPATGTLSYTPDGTYSGPDAFAYSVTDPNTGQVSFPATVKINVANANTGTVRFIPNDTNNLTSTTIPGTLVVTPLPRTDGGTNTITAADVNGVVQVTVNGVVDATQISDTNVDRLVIYGSKANDRITIDPSLSTIATIDGGRGGKNVLTAGAGQTREHGWYGTNKLVQGSGDNFQLGRAGAGNTFVKGTGTSNVIFLGRPGYFPRHLSHNKELMVPTSGTYYKFAKNGKTLVPVASPYGTLNKQARQAFNAQQRAGRVGSRAAGTSGSTGNGTSTTTGNQGTNSTSGTIGASQ